MSETLEELSLEELSEVNFPRPVDEEEVWKILEHVSVDLGYDISGGSFSGFYRISSGRTQERYVSQIGGMISSKDFSRRATFSFPREIMAEDNIFSSMRFNTIPGYDLEEHDTSEVQAWREIRESVKKYFEQKQTKE